MSIYAMDSSGSMSVSVEDVFEDMRGRVTVDDTIILFSDRLHVYKDPIAFMKDPPFPDMGGAEMKGLYDWIAANAPGETLFVYSDGYMMEQHGRQDDGRTIILLTAQAGHDRLDEIFPGARLVPRADW